MALKLAYFQCETSPKFPENLVIGCCFTNAKLAVPKKRRSDRYGSICLKFVVFSSL
jgi:hypothetical protein